MPYELAAMCDILPQVRSIARARVLDVDLYDRGVICRDFPNERVSEAYGRLDFGMLDMSKAEAKRAAQELGWMPIMHRTWFCHAPVNGKPCGTCNPCKDAMAEGMRWRMPLSARLRYRAKLVRSAVFKI